MDGRSACLFIFIFSRGKKDLWCDRELAKGEIIMPEISIDFTPIIILFFLGITVVILSIISGEPLIAISYYASVAVVVSVALIVMYRKA